MALINIKDLPKGSYKVISPAPSSSRMMNIRDIPPQQNFNFHPKAQKKPFNFIGSVKEGLGDAYRGIGGAAMGVVNPFLKVGGSGVRAIESIPALARGDIQESQRIASKPIFGQQTLEGSSNLENLGTAAEVGLTLLGGKVGGRALRNPLKKVADDAIEIASPKLTRIGEEQALREGRVQSGSLFSETKIKPNIQDQRAGEAIQELVRKGTVKHGAKPESNIKAISQEVKRINDGVKNLVAKDKRGFNEAQLRTKLLTAKNDNGIIFASDPTIEKTYDAVIDTFVKTVQKKNPAGLFEARQGFDKIPAIKKLLDSVKGQAGENLRRQAVLDVRRAANEYVADLLPEGNAYKASLLKESNMIRAIENIAEKSTGRAGKTGLQLFAKKHPELIKTLKYVGIGASGYLGGKEIIRLFGQ